MTRRFDRDGLVAAYLDALTSTLDLAVGLTDDQWESPTDLEGWTVGDNVAHVCAIEDELAGRPVPAMAVSWSTRPHVRTPMQQYTEVGVELRRGRSRQDVTDELAELVAERRRQLAAVPADADAELRGPAGFVGTVDRVLGIRVFDIWSHEQDVLRAVGRPARLDCPPAQVAVDRILQALPILLAREAAAPVGTVLRWEVGPPVERTATVRVSEERRGEAVPDGDVAADVVVGCDTETLTLLATGRRPADELDIRLEGDIAVGKRVIDAMPITP